MISAVSAPIVHTSPPPGNLQAGRSNVSLETQTTEENPSQSLAQLTAEEKVIVEKLKKIDQEVRAHERAHKNAGGQFAGSASFGFELGPDGRRYAVSGEVSIDIAPVDGDPAPPGYVSQDGVTWQGIAALSQMRHQVTDASHAHAGRSDWSPAYLGRGHLERCLNGLHQVQNTTGDLLRVDVTGADGPVEFGKTEIESGIHTLEVFIGVKINNIHFRIHEN